MLHQIMTVTKSTTRLKVSVFPKYSQISGVFKLFPFLFFEISEFALNFPPSFADKYLFSTDPTEFLTTIIEIMSTKMKGTFEL